MCLTYDFILLYLTANLDEMIKVVLSSKVEWSKCFVLKFDGQSDIGSKG